MTPQTIIVNIESRMNKRSSSDYDNIPDYQIMKAVNKAALEVCRNIIHGTSITRDTSEENSLRITDIQQLLKPLKVTGSNQNPEYFEAKLPNDFLWYNSVIPKASNNICKKVSLYSKLREQSNVPILLKDFNTKPSFEWRETFHTLINNKIRVYKDSNFIVDELEGSYYRKPIKVDINGYVHENGETSSNVDLEFKDDLAEIILDVAASILAGDIESPNQIQINGQRAQKNL